MPKWKSDSKNHKNYIICKDVLFYHQKDEDAFFEWIEKIASIESISAAKDELYLDLVDRALAEDDVYELIGLFARYAIDMKQLARYRTEANKEAFEPWHQEIFG